MKKKYFKASITFLAFVASLQASSVAPRGIAQMTADLCAERTNIADQTKRAIDLKKISEPSKIIITKEDEVRFSIENEQEQSFQVLYEHFKNQERFIVRLEDNIGQTIHDEEQEYDQLMRFHYAENRRIVRKEAAVKRISVQFSCGRSLSVREDILELVPLIKDMMDDNDNPNVIIPILPNAKTEDAQKIFTFLEYSLIPGAKLPMLFKSKSDGLLSFFRANKTMLETLNFFSMMPSIMGYRENINDVKDLIANQLYNECIHNGHCYMIQSETDLYFFLAQSQELLQIFSKNVRISDGCLPDVSEEQLSLFLDREYSIQYFLVCNDSLTITNSPEGIEFLYSNLIDFLKSYPRIPESPLKIWIHNDILNRQERISYYFDYYDRDLASLPEDLFNHLLKIVNIDFIGYGSYQLEELIKSSSVGRFMKLKAKEALERL